jgi:hypothetical protein
MCGILAVLGSYDKSSARRARILECSRRCVVFLVVVVVFIAVFFKSYLVFPLWSSSWRSLLLLPVCLLVSVGVWRSYSLMVCVCDWTQREMCVVNDDAGWDTEGLTGVGFLLGMAEDVTLHMSAWPSLIPRQATSRCSMRPKKSLLQWEAACPLFPYAALFYFILFWDNFISAVEMCVDAAGKLLLHLCYWSRSF